MYFLNELKRTKGLPPGHVDKKKAETRAQLEYRKCSIIQNRWRKRINPLFSTSRQALDFCNQLCYLLGQKSLRKVVLNSPEVDEFAGAHYGNKEIHFKYGFISFATLMHELAHHFGEYSHGDRFCEVLDFLFRTVFTMIKGKQPKSDW